MVTGTFINLKEKLLRILIKYRSMDNIITYIKSGITAITEIGLGVVSISILAEILFGTGALFGADVIGNITNIVSTIGGSNGLIGLVALFILVALLKK